MDNQKIKQNIQKLQDKLIFTKEGILNPEKVSSSAFSFETTKKSLDDINIKIQTNNSEELIFELIGIDASIANAFRRIMISEIPTMAIEKVNLYQNTSILPDEVLVHRLGLIPIKIDPRSFNNKNPEDDYLETNCIKFKLHVVCYRKPEYKTADKKILENLKPEDYLENAIIYSKQLEWLPFGNQKKNYPKSIRPVHEDIIICKLREGQEIEAELICEKGIGKTHAKWSPVATAFYKLMPDISFKRKIINEQAEKLKGICPMGVFEINQKKEAIVEKVTKCTMCRECLRDDVFDQAIELGKKRDHYIFTIEPVGMLSAKEIFVEAVKILKEKTQNYKSHLTQN